jgi:hypothetical protein
MLPELFVDNRKAEIRQLKAFRFGKPFFYNAKMNLIITQSLNWNFATQHGTMFPCCCMSCPEGGVR